jgi:hypothetical protein
MSKDVFEKFFDELDTQDAITRGEDRVCIVRNHETGDISWRFASPQADPLGMLMRVFWHQMMVESGFRARIEALEKKLEGDDGGHG